MPYSTVSRLGATAALVGAVIVGVAVPLTPHGYGHPLRPLVTLAALAGGILIVLGAPPLFVKIWERNLVLGMISYIALMVALLIFLVALGAIEGILLPYLSTHGGLPAKPPTAMSVLGLVGLAAQVVGAVTLAAAIVWRRAYPWWLAVLLVGSLVMAVLPITIELDATFIAASFVVMAVITLGWRSAKRVPAANSNPQKAGA